MSRGREKCFLMPEFDDRPDNPFCFAIGSGCFNLREALLNPVLLTEGHERVMSWIAPVLLPIVAVDLLYGIWAFFQDLFQKNPGQTWVLSERIAAYSSREKS